MGALLDLALEVDTRAQPPSGAEPLRATTDHEQRLTRAIEMLCELPTRRAAYIAGEESGGIVPMTVVIRTPQGLVTGESQIPKDRWDPLLFLKFLQEQDERSSA